MVGGSLARRLHGGGLQKDMAKYFDQERDDEMDFPPWSVDADAESDLRHAVEDYRDYKDSGFESPLDADDASPSSRSRIPVAVRRRREHDKNGPQLGDDGFRSGLAGTPRYEQASTCDDWRNSNCIESEAGTKMGVTRRLSHAKKGTMSKLDPSPKVGPRVCPHCNRTFAVVSKEGVYVAFSIGRAPLVLLMILAMIVALAPYAYPAVNKFIRSFKVASVPAEPPKPCKGWFC